MAAKDIAGWQAFFERYKQLTARYTIERMTVHADTAFAGVRTVYVYVPAGGGAQRETRLRQTIRFTRSADGWRIANIHESP
jgi:ketosteroid isomerase-like protein